MLMCGFAGYRPQGLSDEEMRLKKRLSSCIDDIIRDGVYEFISTMEKGVDLWAAQVVLDKKRYFPEIRLICAVPFVGVGDRWNWKWQMLYKEILEKADMVRTFHSKDITDGIRESSYWMVERASHIIGVCNEHSRRTLDILKYAERKNLKIKIIKE